MSFPSSVNRRMASWLAAGTGALALAATAAATVPAADAAVTSRPASAAPVMAPAQASGPASINKVSVRQGASVIRCEMVYQGLTKGPHNSGHQPGSVNVRVRVTCDKPVASIQGGLALFQISSKGKILRRTPLRKYASTGRASANTNAALICKPGYYEGDSAAKIVAPPRYVPHTALLRDHSPVVRIAKCN